MDKIRISKCYLVNYFLPPHDIKPNIKPIFKKLDQIYGI